MIYFDHNATTRPAPEVVAAMRRCLEESWGNPSSAHPLGLEPEAALVEAREQVAALIGAQPAELVFTSGGTESLNHAFRGIFEAFPAKRHFVISAVEHSAVQELAAWLRKQGGEVSVLPVDGEGCLDPSVVAAALRPDTALLSVMAANNETGALFPIPELAALAHAQGCLLHTDAIQALGRIPVDVGALGVDLLSGSAHKFHGPKGSGFLYLRRGLRLKPFVLGGSQERGRRGGTENVPGLVGLGEAAKQARLRLPEMARVERLREQLEKDLLARIPGLRVNASGAPRLPNTSLLSCSGVEGEALLLRLGERGICVSTGSACTTGRTEPSHVLHAMGVPHDFARGTIRVSLGLESTEAEVAELVAVLPGLVEQLRKRL